MIKSESIENLKSIADIVDVVGNYVQLKKQGSNYTALCPFHSEKTPSFVVSPAKQIFHCFGCGASGDVIKFIMDVEKLSYPEAIEKLASIYNFKLEYTSKNSFIQTDLLEKINSFYISELFKHKTAYEYLKQRGINDSTVEKFALGFAPDMQTQFRFFKNANLNFTELRNFGVLAENGEYPRLIERISFPIFSPSGKIIAFGGRTISNHPAKYINFTNTKIFNKSKTFYGLNFAREHILRKKQIIITEGYMDVIMLHQAGYNTAVATLGTALTQEHLPQLKKLSAYIHLSYDSDQAGINAALKASKLLYKEFFEGNVILYPQGLDPADIIKNNEDLEKYLKKGIDFETFIIIYTLKKYDLKNPVRKKEAVDEIKEYLNTLPELLYNSFFQKAVQYLQIKPNLLKIRKTIQTQNNLKKIDIAEASIIKTLYEKPQLMDEIIEYLTPEMFNTHSYELSLVYKEDFDNNALLDIIFRDDVKTLDYDKLKKQIIKLLIPYYNNLSLKIKSNPRIEQKEKIHMLKKINLNILKLRKGEMVESIGSI